MSRKFSAARKQAFLNALAETGNQTIAAERAKVSRSWVQLHRSTDPEFKDDVAAAVGKAKEHFDKLSANGDGTRKPPRGWGFLDGEELVVRGTGGSGGGKRVQIARARLKQWTARVEDRFLAVVAATCNVKAACAEVGMTAAGAYNHRTRWPAFARRWDEAMEMACVRLEGALMEAGANFFSSDETPVPGEAGEMPAITGMDVYAAIHLLHMHRYYQPRSGRLPGRRPTRAGKAETAASILRLMAQYERGERRKKARREGRGRHEL